jgi:hypothetical protein
MWIANKHEYERIGRQEVGYILFAEVRQQQREKLLKSSVSFVIPFKNVPVTIGVERISNHELSNHLLGLGLCVVESRISGMNLYQEGVESCLSHQVCLVQRSNERP